MRPLPKALVLREVTEGSFNTGNRSPVAYSRGEWGSPDPHCSKRWYLRFVQKRNKIDREGGGSGRSVKQWF